jgi:hypothetical protein
MHERESERLSYFSAFFFLHASNTNHEDKPFPRMAYPVVWGIFSNVSEEPPYFEDGCNIPPD